MAVFGTLIAIGVIAYFIILFLKQPVTNNKIKMYPSARHSDTLNSWISKKNNE